jgi:hypothetical protein
LRFEASTGKYFMRPYLEKLFTKIGLVEWLKVKTLSSSPSTKKRKERKEGRKERKKESKKKKLLLNCVGLAQRKTFIYSAMSAIYTHDNGRAPGSYWGTLHLSSESHFLS